MDRKPSPGVKCLPLRLVTLEECTLPATGLTAGVSGGVLRVTDWRAGDTLILRQTASTVAVDAAGEQRVFAGVRQVSVDVQSDARVSNDTGGLSGTAARPVYLARRDATG